ncbi:MAG: DNA mismatch repair protein MutL [candidate division WS6 bacterium OLB20]|uniref:DNA mismatch repair protein MutL n=1 Tax=candidate division WS6 bacterium OLB20 TaxID=1617426 RepID=A0A136LXX9_9BACT|nr:MAG: DNA mismatch repair protein MutL [candidate division WS6 bacterium OLB20]
MAIRILPKDVINKIAAGEVIERPASVIKEAIENSIDAGATRIDISIEAGGMQLIEIRDNGSGMNEQDAALAFVQHATSKLATQSDLEEILTLGFRGEALASIASVADNRLHTFDGTTGPVIVTAKDSEVEVNPGQARSQGTTLTVRNIFGSIPARKKFLRSENTEYRHIHDTVTAAALAHPAIGFSLQRDGREALSVQQGQTPAERLGSLFSNIDPAKMLPIHYDGPGISVSGFVSHPELTGRRSGVEYTFLNRRTIRDKLISKAVRDGFQTSIPGDHKPQFVVFIDIDPAQVDVNVHPRKSEVRFTEPGRIFTAVRTAVAGSLENALQNQFRSRLAEDRSPQTSSWRPQTQDSAQVQPVAAAPRSFSASIYSQTQHPRYEGPALTLLDSTKDYQPFEAVQVLRTYIVFERAGSMLVVDQHAADERVKFEQISRQLADETPETQSLLLPLELDLGSTEKAILAEHIERIQTFGFQISEDAGGQYLLYEVPALLREGTGEAVIKEIISGIAESDGEGDTAFHAAREHSIATMACHGSIRAGRKLQPQEMQKLLTDLFACELPYSCPHGRPIIREYTQAELEKEFMRRV